MKAPIIVCISIKSSLVESSSFNASYDPTYGAPICPDPTSVCDTGTLLAGAGHPSEGGSETNAYNTIDDCFDSMNMTHEEDESVERIVIRSEDSNDFSAGGNIIIEATVFTGANTTDGRRNPNVVDIAQFFHTTNPSLDAKWTFIDLRWAWLKRGSQTLSVTYTLPEADIQAVRVKFGYDEMGVAPCGSENDLTDIDDLVFAVNPGPDPPTMIPSPPTTPSPTKEFHRMAVYDFNYGSPRCVQFGSACDTGAKLIAGVGSGVGGPEPNSPNVIDDCIELSSTVYGKDESIDRISIKSADGSIMSVGTSVTIEATVSTATSTNNREQPIGPEVAHFYHTADPSFNTNWVYISTVYASLGTGSQVLSCQLTLPEGEIQAVRVNYGYQENVAGPCTNNGPFTDVDDLVFAVASQPTSTPTAAPTESMAPSESLVASESIVPTYLLSEDHTESTEELEKSTWFNNFWPLQTSSSSRQHYLSACVTWLSTAISLCLVHIVL
jgi:hypothetical protein